MKKLWVVLPIIAFCLVLVFAVTRNFHPKQTYEVIVFGDSLVGNDRSENSITQILSELTGKNVLNAGFGGTCMSGKNNSTWQGERWHFLSMSELASAYGNSDFSVQKSVLRSKDMTQPEYFESLVSTLIDTDIQKTEFIFIEHGVNDYLSQIPIDNELNPNDTDTFGGALRESIRNIRRVDPGATIILMTPVYCNLSKEGVSNDCFHMDYGSGLLEEYVNKELEIAKELNVTVIDNFHESGIGPDTYAEYLWDGLHTNEAGNRLLAERMKQVMEEINAD